jgi:hypothetical protein
MHLKRSIKSWVRFVYSLFSSRSAIRWLRIRIFRLRVILIVQTAVKASNATKAATRPNSPARDTMSKVWQARHLPASRANAYKL